LQECEKFAKFIANFKRLRLKLLKLLIKHSQRDSRSPDGNSRSSDAESNSPAGTINSPDDEVNSSAGIVNAPDDEVNPPEGILSSPDAMAFDKDEMADNALTDGAAAETPTSGGQVPAAHPPPDIKFFQSVALRDWKLAHTTAAADTITAAIRLYVYLRNLFNFTPPPPTHTLTQINVYNRPSLRNSTVNLRHYVKPTFS
jgi:hypothetical protein